MEANLTVSLKAKILQTFLAFTKFCNENNIKYYAAYGTAIGAIRHNGFIPWDDDIDVHMFRKDYKRFLSLKNKVPKPYKIADISEIGYTGPFAKFMDMSTSHWENKNIPYMFGVYIDILPLDDCLESSEDTLYLMEKYRSAVQKYINSLGKYKFKDISLLLLNGKLRTAYHNLLTKIYHSKNTRRYYEEMIKIEKRIECIHGSRLCYSPTAYFYKKVPFFEKEWFQDVINIPFESTTINVPIGYDKYLRLIYGDYMQLPPENERISTHNHYYLNLSEGLTIEQAKERISKSKMIIR